MKTIWVALFITGLFLLNCTLPVQPEPEPYGYEQPLPTDIPDSTVGTKFAEKYAKQRGLEE